MSDCLMEAFEEIASALADAEKARLPGAARAAAEQCGLVELGDGKPSQHTVWERHDGEMLLRFEWRWYDQSKAFSIQPDMNILALKLLKDGKVIREVERRYED